MSGDKFNEKESQIKFLQSIVEFVKQGKGLMLWANGEKHFHANLIMNNLPIEKDLEKAKENYLKLK